MSSSFIQHPRRIHPLDEVLKTKRPNIPAKDVSLSGAELTRTIDKVMSDHRNELTKLANK